MSGILIGADSPVRVVQEEESLQLCPCRRPPDPRQVPVEVAGPSTWPSNWESHTPRSCRSTGSATAQARSHAGEIQQDGGWRDFAEVREELAAWLRERRVLLQGVSRLAQLVASVREADGFVGQERVLAQIVGSGRGRLPRCSNAVADWLLKGIVVR
nr:hypothetical protein [Streptomyces sp. Ag109_G2-6]